ncbi:MAG: hypothetical protein M9904_13105 [Chitinophagaceae bacterium]|nr:hypothetical protein [Chitinophagaceae bacterium]
MPRKLFSLVGLPAIMYDGRGYKPADRQAGIRSGGEDLNFSYREQLCSIWLFSKKTNNVENFFVKKIISISKLSLYLLNDPKGGMKHGRSGKPRNYHYEIIS